MKKQTPDFKFFMPIEITKAKNKDGQEEMLIEGIASDRSEDSDGEVLEPTGYELDYFKKFGLLNWQHRASVDPSSIVGEPIDAKIQDNKFYIKGRLFNNNPLAEQIYALAKSLSDSGSTRRLGFSIEGKALERDLLNNKIIKRAKITGVAITPTPKNANTFLDVCKGTQVEGDPDYEYDEEIDEEVKKILTTTTGAALTKESLEGDLKDLKKTKKTLTKSEVFGEIFATFPEIDLEKSKSIYSFITEVQTKLDSSMKNISQDAIDAAKQILKAASDELSKAEGNVASTSAPKQQGASNSANGASQEEFSKKLNMYMTKAIAAGKSKDDCMKAVKAEMGDEAEGKDEEMEKAYEMAKKMHASTEKASKIAMKKAEIAKAQKDLEDLEAEDDEDEEEPVAKSDKMKKNADMSKGYEQLEMLMKSHTNQISEKIGALGTMQLAADENTEILKAEIAKLSKRLADIESQPAGKKTVHTTMYLEKGAKDDNDIHKGKQVLKLNDKPTIMKALEATIDLEKAEQSLVNEFLQYESTGHLTKGLVNTLGRSGYAFVQ